MTIEEVERARKDLSGKVARRYAERAAHRKVQRQKVEQEGIFVAAGIEEATRRAAHMTVAEGRAAMQPRAVAERGKNGRVLEARIGADDSDGVAFLGRGQVAARAVCRLVQGQQALGTGFLVAPGVLLTNHHVIRGAEDASEFVAEFDYELDIDDQPRVPVVRFALDPERMFVTSEELDFTFVAVNRSSLSGSDVILDFGWIPLDPQKGKILEGEPAVIIQHPRGEQKRLCLFASELVDKLDTYLHYTTDTDFGSSGSCVFNRSWQLVALHHAAGSSDERRKGLPTVVNEGIRVSVIVGALREHDGRVSGDVDAVYEAISAPEVVRDGRPRAGSPLPRRPVTSPAVAERAGRVELERTSIRSRPPTHFDGRAGEHFGYKPAFLGARAAVPLPRPTGPLRGDVVVPDGAGDDGGELRYTHYSVVMSASRRLPAVTAVNIDGAQSVRLRRTDRELVPRLSRHPFTDVGGPTRHAGDPIFEAADVWHFDPRIPKEAQLGPELYDRTAFDFGHMVRREDPVWGEPDTARMANDDTFFMTNSTPQHHDLNTKSWLQLENAILDAARRGRRRMSVYTGPVLSPQDPLVLGVQVPTGFWKIVAYSEGGRLRAQGFMQWQTRLVRSIRVRPESLAELDDVAEFQVPIRDIARATALDFGPLFDADELRGGRRRRLDDTLLESLFAGWPGEPAPEHDGGDDEPSSGAPERGEIPGLLVDRTQVAALLEQLRTVLGSLSRLAVAPPEVRPPPSDRPYPGTNGH